jgi:tRNA 2-thiocytidine biosynthesis protein TtcA
MRMDALEPPDRLPIISFLIRCPADSKGCSRFLHTSFVCALLNDVFGIQTRGGCACAGPYALHLLGIDDAKSFALEKILLEQTEVMRPGFVRLSLTYFTSRAEVDYTLAALQAVANHGWRLLPLYRLDAKSGIWRHKARVKSFPERKWLAHMHFPAVYDRDKLSTIPTYDGPRRSGSPPEFLYEISLRSQLRAGIELLKHCGQENPLKCLEVGELSTEYEGRMLFISDQRHTAAVRLKSVSRGDRAKSGLPVSSEFAAKSFRWFMFPSEASELLSKATYHVKKCQEYKNYSHFPLSQQPSPGELQGALCPRYFREDSGALSDETSFRGGYHPFERNAGFEVQEDTPRMASKKYPLYGKSGTCGLHGGFARQRIMSAILTSRISTKEEIHMLRNTSEGVESSSVGSACDRQPPLSSIQDADDSDSRDGNAVLSGVNTCDLDLSGDIHSEVQMQNKFAEPPPKLLSLVSKAVSQWNMIDSGDRVLLGLSGGKDSMAMLHILKALQRRYPPGTFELFCCTIDPGTEAYNPRPLVAYLDSLGVKYHYIEENIMDMATKHMSGDSICAFCARMKRGALYTCMRQHGYNKLVLAQHLDDIVESFFMSAMHNGVLRTMKASYVVRQKTSTR